ncbi:hypothetical protein CBR_g26502 [Chara braunii]|uniref:Uncharacterized protein n=1 Tax=Chara braunii TaxID=69332 RepID=A0A388L8B2_CHABU|nr:hypothetical protein CBR_g26502 [Chara braunii]|eukprot:GBG78472.1 hypothetical protein CBR_g26502 [Chara braunii]
MAASIQGVLGNGSSGLLLAPSSSSAQVANSTGTSNAIVPYRAPVSKGFNNDGGYNGGNNGGFRNFQNDRGQRYSKPWGGGFRDRDDRFDKIYGLLAEQAEEREQCKQELAKLELLEAEKKKLQVEEEKCARDRKERELQEARLGKIVKSSMKAVCESVLGKKVEIPDDDESEVSKIRRELEDLKSRCANGKKDSAIDALRKEKEALQMAQNQSSEEATLRREIEELKLRNEKRKLGEESDEIVVLRMQMQELEKVRVVLDDRSGELSALKSENLHLKKDVLDLKGVVDEIKGSGKRSVEEVATKSPPIEPTKGKQRMVPIGADVYTPKDLEALHKLYKEALEGKEAADKKSQALKERMARMGAQMLSKQRTSIRRTLVRKTTPRNLKPVLNAVRVDDSDADDDPEEPRKTKAIEEVQGDSVQEQLGWYQEQCKKELRPAKKADMQNSVKRKALHTSSSINLRLTWLKSEPEECLSNG